MVREKKNYTLPIIVMFFLFAMISFVTGFQNPFGIILKEQLHLSNLQSQLGNFANFIAYAFMGIPAGMILQKKGYKFSAIVAVIVGLIGVAFMFLSSLAGDSKSTIITIYLIGAFVAGFSMCMLNTVVNPMLNTLGGGGKKGNQLLQYGGATNSLAATICPVLVGYLIGDNLRGITLIDARPALYIAMAIFAIAFIVLACSHLPEPILEELKRGGGKVQPKMKGLLKFRHFILGIIAIFLYVGIEVGIPNMANLFMTTISKENAIKQIDKYNRQQADEMYLAECMVYDKEHSGDSDFSARVVTKEQYDKACDIRDAKLPSGLGISATIAGSLVGMYWLLMLVGRLMGGIVGGRISSRVMLSAVSSVALVFLLLGIFLPIDAFVKVPGFSSNLSFSLYDMPISILFFVLCGLCTSIMWGGIFNLAVEGLGKYTAAASGFFMMMVCGGGVLPLIQGAVADASSFLSSYWVLAISVGYLLWYAIIGSKVLHRDSSESVK